MKPWTPLVITVVLAFLINFFPIFMAFVIKVDGWAQVGWVFYLFTIPLSGLLILIGGGISLRLYFKKRDSA